MRVLVINSGSSSIKYQLIDMQGSSVVSKGMVERIGEDNGTFSHDGESEDRTIKDHGEGFAAVFDLLSGRDLLSDLGGIGHRVVHGGERYSEPTVIDDSVIRGIKELSPLAPLHNPANAAGIEVARKLRPEVPHVAVFDTSFHRSLPPHAYRYAIPTVHYRNHGVRRYGMHGTSHAYVARVACEVVGVNPQDTNLITAHLGNGASMAAIRNGECVDTSMGLSPLEGLVMGTRSGDIDPTVIFHLLRETDMNADDVETMLNRDSGLKGLCDENDVRVITERAEKGDETAQLAIDVFVHRIRKYIGAYLAVLGHTDLLVFTAGIGEHAPEIRERVCARLDGLGIVLDSGLNAEVDGTATVISRQESPVTILVVPTNEELEIATQTAHAISA